MFDSTGGTRPIVVAGRPATEVAVARFSVKVLEGPDTGATATLAATALEVGCDRACDLVLTDAKVSRKHLRLTLTREGVLVSDLESKNGTRLDGTRIREAYVADGGHLVIGDSTLEVRIDPGRFVVFTEDERSF